MSIDVRTRVDTESGGASAQRSPSQILELDLPARIDAAADLADSWTHLELRPLTLDVDGSTWRLQLEGGRLEISPAAPGSDGLRLALTSQQLRDLIDDQVTPVGLMTAGTLALTGGGIGRLLDWWLVLRSVLDGRPVHRPGAVIVNADLARSFEIGSDAAEQRAFLEEAGFLHLTGVFGTDEMAAISADMDAAEPTYRVGDDNSWWATLDDGSQRVVRMQRFHERSEATAALLADARLAAISDMAGVGHLPQHMDGNRIEALFKPIGVNQGISDVPWHKDCSLGRHSYECCSLTVGISVTGAGPTTGQLRVLAGSHRALVWPSLVSAADLDFPDVALATETGDVTVHLSCTLHMAQPPTNAERRVLYTGFVLPPADPSSAAAANRRLLAASRERAPLTTGHRVPPPA